MKILKSKLSKILLIIAIILLIILNPSIKNFKEFVGYNEKQSVVKKTRNFIVFSRYDLYIYTNSHFNNTVELVGLDGYYFHYKYVGFCLNFWEIK